MITENVKHLLAELKNNNFGEKVVLVAATKTRSPEEVREAIAAGISAVGENKVQEFREKYDAMQGAERHFIGHLQTNKVKYLVGRCDLIHSVDRDELAEEIARRAERLGVVQNILVQINAGNEETKGGYSFEAGREAFFRLKERAGLRPRGFMAMLPLSDDEGLLAALADRMRALLDGVNDPDARILSMGMSGDWKVCVAHGSNMVRLGTGIFGARQYFPAK